MNDCASCLNRKRRPIAGVKFGTFCSEGSALTPCATATIETTLRKDYHRCVTDYKPVSTKKKEKKRIVLSDNVPSEKKRSRCSKKPHVIAAAVLIYVSTKLFRRNVFRASCKVRALPLPENNASGFPFSLPWKSVYF